MRLLFVFLFVIFGANLMIELLDSNLVETYNQRKDALERLTSDLK